MRKKGVFPFIGELLVLLGAMLAISVAAEEQAPEWSKKSFPAPPDKVFAAALKSIAAQHHEVKSTDDANKVVSFHVGTTAWSWGYNMVLKVTPAENNGSNVSVEIARSGGKAVSWGSGEKKLERSLRASTKSLPRHHPQKPNNTTGDRLK